MNEDSFSHKESPQASCHLWLTFTSSLAHTTGKSSIFAQNQQSRSRSTSTRFFTTTLTFAQQGGIEMPQSAHFDRMQQRAENLTHPRKSKIERIRKLPTCRRLRPKQQTSRIELRSSNQKAAVLGQRRGQVASSACAQCSAPSAKFHECVVVPGFFSGACCNCVYHYKGSSCSFRYVLLRCEL